MPTTSLPESRATRGLALFRERGGEIVSYVDGTFGVPSRTEDGVIYLVDLLGAETCSCPDRTPDTEACLHMVAAEAKRAEMLREARARTDEAKRRSEAGKRERIRFTPEQIERNLARMGA